MIKQIKNCFAKEPVNLGRQKELDIAKGMAVIFIIFCHGFEILSNFFDPEISTDIAYGLLDVVLGGSFSAPVFMFCMGICLCYSRRNSAKSIFNRALRIAGIAFLLEVTRTAIPGFLEWLIYRDPECIDYVRLFFGVDILQFAALALLTIALFKKLKLKPVVMLIIAVVCSVAGQLLQGVSTGSVVGDSITGFIWRSYEYSLFPLLSWLIIPVCGYVFGHAWQRIQDKETFFRWVTPISWIISIAYFVSMALVGVEYYLSGGDYYALGIGDAAFAFVACFAMIGLGYYLAKWKGCVSNWLRSLGSRVTSVYCIHWTLYCFLLLLMICVQETYVSQWAIIPTAILVMIVSDMLSRLYMKIKLNGKNSK